MVVTEMGRRNVRVLGHKIKLKCMRTSVRYFRRVESVEELVPGSVADRERKVADRSVTDTYGRVHELAAVELEQVGLECCMCTRTDEARLAPRNESAYEVLGID